jgi:dsRNA-specific ribonuclease
VLSHAVNGRDIGTGRGFSKGLAKKEAAIRALKTLESIRIDNLL